MGASAQSATFADWGSASQNVPTEWSARSPRGLKPGGPDYRLSRRLAVLWATAAIFVCRANPISAGRAHTIIRRSGAQPAARRQILGIRPFLHTFFHRFKFLEPRAAASIRPSIQGLTVRHAPRLAGLFIVIRSTSYTSPAASEGGRHNEPDDRTSCRRVHWY
jgi:hypothetical protein